MVLVNLEIGYTVFSDLESENQVVLIPKFSLHTWLL